MKIVHFIPILRKGGAERVVIDLANEAAARGHHVSVVAWAPAAPKLGTDALRKEITIRYVDSKGGAFPGAYLRLLPWVFRNREWLLGQDVVHCHLSMGSAFGAAVQLLRRLQRRRGPTVVETYHAVGMAIPTFNRWAHALLLARRDAVAFMAEDSYWRRYRAARNRRLFRTIPNGVAFPEAPARSACARYRREAGIPKDAVVIASVGRLVAERRPNLLLNTFENLANLVDRNIHLLLAGEGPMRAWLADEACRLGLQDRVHLPGLIVNPAEAFGITDLYLTVNVGPTTGIAALEAASVGLPVVAVQLDSSHSRHETEWIWASANPLAVAEHVAVLLDNPTRLRETGEAQRAVARSNHSVETMADSYERFYRDAFTARRIAGTVEGY